VGLLALAFAALAGSAMAQQIDNQNYNVNIDVNVLPIVSVWSNDLNLTLNMQGNDGNNSAAVESHIYNINNVDANITAKVSGNLPDPTGGPLTGNGIFFYIFQNVSAAAAMASTPAYTPPGALVWSKDGHGGSTVLGGTQTLVANTGIDLTAELRPITYMVRSPGETLAVNSADYYLDVLYTIAAN
jgi:hypothetical protein